MAINKVQYAGVVLIDLTEDTVEPNKLAEGITAHNKKGERITGNGSILNAQPQITVTPSATEQIIEPESPYNALSKVIVLASTGGSTTLPPFASGMAYLVTGDCTSLFRNGVYDDYITSVSTKIATEGITNGKQMFQASNVEQIPFSLNFDKYAVAMNVDRIFGYCANLKEQPIMNGCRPNSAYGVFQGCNNIRYIREPIFDKGEYTITDRSLMFQNCYSLRVVNLENLIADETHYTHSRTYHYTNSLFRNCYVLEEATLLPTLYKVGYELTRTGLFNGTFNNCERLSRVTFDAYGESVFWANQTINLSVYVGYSEDASHILDYNSGITANKEVMDDDTYNALKNDPDWFTCDISYSRYNHASAVETINSLPDTSEAGSNMIMFASGSGAMTEDGGIDDLTEEEIAVAEAKGWTVSIV